MPSRDLIFVDLPAGFAPAVSSSAPQSAPPSAPDPCSAVHSPVGSFLCHPSSPWAWLSYASAWAWRTIQAWWPLLVVVAVVALTTGALLAIAVRRARADAADRASWVEVTPPAVLPVDGARGLWRALEGLLSRTRRHGFAPHHLAVEFLADAAGMRVGVWVPPALSARSVAEAIVRCWPGSRATITRTPPTVTDGEASGRVTAVHVVPRGGGWTPLLDATHTVRRQPGSVAGGVDSLHSVLAELAERGEGEAACAQLIVSHARTRTVSSQRRNRPLWARALIGLVRLPFVVLLAVADVLLTRGTSRPRTATTPTSSTPDDPAVVARRKAVEAKQAHGPHLHATLRLAIGSPASRGLRRRAVNAIVNGYDLTAPEASLATRRVSRPAWRLADRVPGRGRDRFLITLDEAAALWHLPDEPAQYGITDATTRIRRPRRDLPRYDPRRRNPRRRPDQPEGGHDAAA
jgi:hypothetical protein